MTKENIKELEKKLEENHPGYKIIYMSYYGSKLFGTNNPNSDTDYFGLFLPSKKDIYLKKDAHFISFNTNNEGKNTKDDNDIKFCSVFEFFRLLKNGDHEKFDLLFSMFSPSVLIETEESNIIKENYKKLLTKKPEAFVGFALKQANKYSVKGDRLKLIESLINSLNNEFKINKSDKIENIFPLIKEKYGESIFIEFINKEEGNYISVLNRLYVSGLKYKDFLTSLCKVKETYGDRAERAKNAEGIDFKAFSHAFRAIIEAEELLKTGFISLPLKNKDLEFVKDVKNGKYTDIDFLSNFLESGMENLLKEKEKSILAERIKDKDIEDILLQIFKLK